MVLKMISKNVTDRTLRGFIMQEDAIEKGLDTLLNVEFDFAHDLYTRVLPVNKIPELKNKKNKDVHDYCQLGIYHLHNGEIYEAQGQFQEALRLRRSVGEIRDPLRVVSSNILHAHSYLKGTLSELMGVESHVMHQIESGLDCWSPYR